MVTYPISIWSKVNVLGPFVLTRLLEPLLVKAKQPRIVNVASVMHRFNEMPSPEVFMRYIDPSHSALPYPVQNSHIRFPSKAILSTR